MKPEQLSKDDSILAIASAIILLGGIFILASLNVSPSTTGEQIPCTQEARLCPEGSYVGRTGPNCEFAPCPSEVRCEGISCEGVPLLPQGYTLKSYFVEKTLDTACATNSECETPGEYTVQSRCPFTSLCLKNKCTVVCPTFNKH